MRLGLVYLPSAELSSLCERYARSLTTGLVPRMLLGPHALAHLSLLHVEAPIADDDDALALWSEAKSALPAEIRFDILALGLLRYDTPYNAEPAPAATMAWLMAPCTETLRRAERTAVALPAFAALAQTTSNADTFQPHLTIAMWEGHTAPTFTAPSELLPSSGHAARLALGVIGPNGTYQRTLFC